MVPVLCFGLQGPLRRCGANGPLLGGKRSFARVAPYCPLTPKKKKYIYIYTHIYISPAGLIRGQKLTKRFIFAGFVSRPLLGLDVGGLFFVKRSLRKFAKSLGIFFVLDHLGPSFWRNVSGGAFSCGAEHVFGPLKTRGK